MGTEYEFDRLLLKAKIAVVHYREGESPTSRLNNIILPISNSQFEYFKMFLNGKERGYKLKNRIYISVLIALSMDTMKDRTGPNCSQVGVQGGQGGRFPKCAGHFLCPSPPPPFQRRPAMGSSFST